MATSRSARRLVLAHMRPGRGAAAALLSAIAATTVLPLVAPQFTRAFVDGAIAGEPTRTLVLLAVGYLLLATGGQLMRMVTAWLASRLAWDGTNRLREDLAAHALGLDMAFHGRHTPGELIERVDGDVVALADFTVSFLLDVVMSLLTLVGVLAVLLFVDWRIGGALLVYCTAVGAGMVRVQRLAVPAWTRLREEFARLFGTLEERLVAAEDLRANGAGDHAVGRFHAVSADLYRADRRANHIGGGLYAGTTVAFAAGTAGVLALAAVLRQGDALTVGTAVLLFQYTQMVRTPFERLIDQLPQLQRALAAVSRVGTLLAERPTLAAPAAPQQLPAHGALGLELDRVDFSYTAGDEQVLHQVSLRLAPGETLGLVGRTGSGKTTIARLALRLYDPTAGVVRVGGVDLQTADPSALRSRMAVVTQDVQLFAANVRDNLTLFRDGYADDARLHQLLVEVGLGDWLAGLPDGLDTELAPQDGGVSAGEAQLLAFARVFLQDPGLVVLDEAASRLDPVTEQRVDAAVARLLADRTGILIAHRIASLERVDTIAVVEHGRVVEYGPRAALAADPTSRFARLRQTAEVDS